MKSTTKNRLPEFLRPYFWDVEFENVNKETSKKFVIKRVLDRGNIRDVRYVVNTYGKDAIKDVVLGTRDLARPTGNFWADILGLDKTQVPCLQKPYSPIHFGLFS